MTGPIGGNYTSGIPSSPGYSPAIQDFIKKLNAYLNYLVSNNIPVNSSLAAFFDQFNSQAQSWISANPNAEPAQVQAFINQFISGGGDFYLQFYGQNQDWSDPKGNLNKDSLYIFSTFLVGYKIPQPQMSYMCQTIYDILTEYGTMGQGTPVYQLFRELLSQIFSNGTPDPGTFLNTILPWMQEVIQSGFAGFPGLTEAQKRGFIQDFYSSYIGLLKDWNNPNAAAFIQELEAIFGANPNGLSAAAAELVNILVNAALSHNNNDPNFLSAFEMVMLNALVWSSKCAPNSLDAQLANFLLAELVNLGPNGSLEALRKWAIDFVYNPQNAWIWNASQDALTQFGELTGVLMTAKQYRSEMASWLKEHAGEKGTPLYQFVKWIENLIIAFQTANKDGTVPDMEKYLNQYITSDIYNKFPGLTYAQVSAFYGADMPPGMVPPPQA